MILCNPCSFSSTSMSPLYNLHNIFVTTIVQEQTMGKIIFIFYFSFSLFTHKQSLPNNFHCLQHFPFLTTMGYYEEHDTFYIYTQDFLTSLKNEKNNNRDESRVYKSA